jgi:hypothetical protein
MKDDNELATKADIRLILEKIDTRFGKSDERFDSIDRRFEGVDARFDSIGKRFDSIDGRFEGVDVRFDSIESRMATKNELAALSAREQQHFDYLNQNIDKVLTIVIAMNDNLVPAVKDHEKRLKRLETRAA